MEILIKKFSELSRKELYDVLALRSEVFVVEQACAYLDVDGKDAHAHHLLCIENKVLIAYLRLFLEDSNGDNANIGRVVVRSTHRKKGLAIKIMKKAMAFIKTQQKGTPIELSAQRYLVKFYGDLGFSVEGDGYLEDGIPHIKMVYQPTS
ncbi:MAG: GNAT family N-acetyltransferase [Allomuricauda sp.]|nr:MAG: GNAT family N-acetyltransferase [Allomuricauda sp.]